VRSFNWQNRRAQNASEVAKGSNTHHFEVLLVGPPRAGKTTILKKLASRYGTWHDYFRRDAIRYVILSSVKTLCLKADQKNVDEKHADLKQRIQEKALNPFTLLELSKPIAALWCDQKESGYLDEDSKYYLDRLDSICQPNYVPTEADLSHLNTLTGKPGINEDIIFSGGVKWKIIDINQNDQKKLYSYFEKPDILVVVIPFAPIKDLKEHLDYFEQLTNNKNLQSGVDMILVFNKRDLLISELKQVRFQDVWSKYHDKKK